VPAHPNAPWSWREKRRVILGTQRGGADGRRRSLRGEPTNLAMSGGFIPSTDTVRRPRHRFGSPPMAATRFGAKAGGGPGGGTPLATWCRPPRPPASTANGQLTTGRSRRPAGQDGRRIRLSDAAIRSAGGNGDRDKRGESAVAAVAAKSPTANPTDRECFRALGPPKRRPGSCRRRVSHTNAMGPGRRHRWPPGAGLCLGHALRSPKRPRGQRC